jgi:phosphopantetheine--protein transferase-like protein
MAAIFIFMALVLKFSQKIRGCKSDKGCGDRFGYDQTPKEPGKKVGREVLRRVFTPNERRELKTSPFPYESLAGKFAAKEAFLKALGKGLFEIPFLEIEVLKEERGKPFICLHGKAKQMVQEINLKNIHLSISHDGGIAMALVILEVEDEACNPRRNEGTRS